MRDLLNFLLRYSHWFLFLLLEALCLVLIGRTARYQQSVFFSSANYVVGKVYDMAGVVTSYFHLKDANEDLLDRNIWLEQRVAFLEKALADETGDTLTSKVAGKPLPGGYWTFKAHVIKNSLTLADNYITLDKGSAAGVRPDMGVVGAAGVVGIVYRTSPRYSLVIPLLNSKSSVSCKIQGSDYFGYLKWEGDDPCYAYLKDLPRHAEFSLGDTVVTSGFSSVFPQGLMVGTVDDMADSNDGLSYLLKVKLATDFGKLGSVRILARSGQAEQKALEKTVD
ncbi:rod shape-determining protein MreC [uncultured Mediterranea sp.]|uniref:rod shape-determining protein MreC n=1 Tax=uncultured Mediterranea sp. TaxID=1926662 RepID=UPI002804E095|nr:rod shape-determining protein MreC [uncultured Mediterranea sp.]